MADPTGWEVVAYNQATTSENKIHDDTIARKYGFRGGLVPGVTVYAYMVQPAIVSWGLDWLSRGAANVVLRKPVYEGDRARVECKADGSAAYQGEVIDPEDSVRPEGTRSTLERLRESGLGSLRLEWQGRPPYDRYTQTIDEMADLVRHDVGGFAHPGFTLGLANLMLTVNVTLGPWIHVQSEIQHFAPVPLRSRLHVEAEVTDLFERRGHEFIDLDVAAFLDPDQPALRATHRAIYQLR
jgi:acyl dehydratase